MFPDFNNLIKKIQKYCADNQLEYLDGIPLFCEQNSIEIEVVADLIKKDPILVEKLQYEAENRNFIKRVGSKVSL